jgi:hypothetical protein
MKAISVKIFRCRPAVLSSLKRKDTNGIFSKNLFEYRNFEMGHRFFLLKMSWKTNTNYYVTF